MDIGCACGGVLLDIRHKLSVDVVGVDIRPPKAADMPFPIWSADAARGRLPQADAPFCMYLGHHLSEEDLVNLIGNAGRFFADGQTRLSPDRTPFSGTPWRLST
jgi:hypothetical protein